VKAIVITGPTATGKTRLAVALARRFQGEIISADSRQVYRRLDIGTGKDLQEYSEGGETVPTHLLDVVEPDEEFHLFRYLQLAWQALKAVSSRGRLPFLVGGTPLYLNAILDGYQLEGAPPDLERREQLELLDDAQLLQRLRELAPPDLFARTDKTQRRRLLRAVEMAEDLASGRPAPVFPPGLDDYLILAPLYPRPLVHQRMAERLDARLEQGLIEEVQGLLDSGISPARLDWLGLEYRYVGKYLSGELSRQEMRDTLLAHIRQFGKRQDIWFRKMEREGKTIHWLPEGNLEQATALVADFLSKTCSPQA
jgi:tRNA dimethylallyltransferase